MKRIWHEILDGDFSSLFHIFIAALIIFMVVGAIVQEIKAEFGIHIEVKQTEPAKK